MIAALLAATCFCVYCSAAALARVAGAGHRAAWPTRPIRIMQPYPAGGLTDVFSRA